MLFRSQAIISDALVKLNYKENKVARILANGKTEFIGIIIPPAHILLLWGFRVMVFGG